MVGVESGGRARARARARGGRGCCTLLIINSRMRSTSAGVGGSRVSTTSFDRAHWVPAASRSLVPVREKKREKRA